MTDVVEQKANLPVAGSFYDEITQEAGAGFENVQGTDMSIPFLQVVQSTSPQLKKSSPKYLEAAKPGMVVNSTTNELFSAEQGLWFVPAYWEKQYTEWVPREKGGGFAGQHGEEIMDQVKSELGRDFLPNGNEIVQAAVFYGLVLDNDGNTMPAVISMAKTQFKVSKKLLFRLRSFTAKIGDKTITNLPMYSMVVNLQTREESNDKGSWSLWHPDVIKLLPDFTMGNQQLASQIKLQAKALHEGLKSGKIKVADPAAMQEDAPASNANTTGTTAAGRGDETEDEIPY